MSKLDKPKKEFAVATMRKLHECATQDKYEEEWPRVRDMWLAKGLDTFVEYFESTWLTGNATKWQVFQSPIGFSTTNNPIESFNNKLKSQFTMRVLMCNYMISFI